MSSERRVASKLRIHKVEPGNHLGGGDLRGVQILFKEAYTAAGGRPNAEPLRRLMEGQGWKVTEGFGVADTPMERLCVGKEGEQLTVGAVLAVLQADPEIDLPSVKEGQG
jgi:hypothetical protein